MRIADNVLLKRGDKMKIGKGQSPSLWRRRSAVSWPQPPRLEAPTTRSCDWVYILSAGQGKCITEPFVASHHRERAQSICGDHGHTGVPRVPSVPVWRGKSWRSAVSRHGAVTWRGAVTRHGSSARCRQGRRGRYLRRHRRLPTLCRGRSHRRRRRRRHGRCCRSRH